MTSRPSFRSFLGASAMVVGLLAGTLAIGSTAIADGVSDAQQQVDQVLDDLDTLRDQMGQIDEDYAAALDRQDALVVEIAGSQARIDELTAEVGDVQLVLQQIAVDRFTGGDSLSPIFSDAATYSAAAQRAALGAIAIDSGRGNIDGLQSLVDNLAVERATLQRKRDEQTSLIATLAQKQVDYDALEQSYVTKQATAKAALGDALQAAEDARAAAAVAKASARKATTSRGVTVAAPRGGGGDTGGAGNNGNNGNNGNGGGTAGDGGSTGSGEVPVDNAPPVSGKAGIAVSAAWSAIGTPYGFAGETPGVSFDCSGLTKWAWGRAGVGMPHQSGAQYGSFPHVSQSEAQPGDLIFYYSPIGHVGLYIGGGQMIHAPNTGTTVTVATVHWNKVVGVARPG